MSKLHPKLQKKVYSQLIRAVAEEGGSRGKRVHIAKGLYPLMLSMNLITQSEGSRHFTKACKLTERGRYVGQNAKKRTVVKFSGPEL